MTQTIKDLITALADEIRSDPRTAALEESRRAYEDDRTLQSLIFEYNIQQRALAEERGRDGGDTGFIEAIEARISALFDDIRKNDNYIGFAAAKLEFEEFYSEINSELARNISGEGGCGHEGGCSGCTGCTGCGSKAEE